MMETGRGTCPFLTSVESVSDPSLTTRTPVNRSPFPPPRPCELKNNSVFARSPSPSSSPFCKRAVSSQLLKYQMGTRSGEKQEAGQGRTEEVNGLRPPTAFRVRDLEHGVFWKSCADLRELARREPETDFSRVALACYLQPL